VATLLAIVQCNGIVWIIKWGLAKRASNARFDLNAAWYNQNWKYLIKICNLLNISLLFLNHASTVFVILDVFVILLINILPALLLPLPFTLKLTIVTYFCYICLQLKLIVLNSSSTLLLVLIPVFSSKIYQCDIYHNKRVGMSKKRLL